MEVILDVFFERLDQIDRNCLHSRCNRRVMVDYFNTLIEGFRLGEDIDVQIVVRETVKKILDYHESAKKQNGNICKMGKYHNVLYVALKICHDWQLEDVDTVCCLLKGIFECEKTFERLMVGAIFGTRAPHFIAGWKSDFDTQEDNLRALVYYMDKASSPQFYYLNDEDTPMRFIDVPIECCAKSSALKIVTQLGLPDKVHIFLRFGAEVGFKDDALKIVLDKLSECSERRYPYNLVACLSYILRAIPSICLEYPKNDTLRQHVLENYLFLVEDGILPLDRCGIVPTGLKHLCRCRIRNILWKNFRLPKGIQELPIPDKLRRYLDIMED